MMDRASFLKALAALGLAPKMLRGDVPLPEVLDESGLLEEITAAVPPSRVGAYPPPTKRSGSPAVLTLDGVPVVGLRRADLRYRPGTEIDVTAAGDAGYREFLSAPPTPELHVEVQVEPHLQYFYWLREDGRGLPVPVEVAFRPPEVVGRFVSMKPGSTEVRFRGIIRNFSTVHVAGETWDEVLIEGIGDVVMEHVG